MEPLAPVTASVSRMLEAEEEDSVARVTQMIIAQPAKGLPDS